MALMACGDHWKVVGACYLGLRLRRTRRRGTQHRRRLPRLQEPACQCEPPGINNANREPVCLAERGKRRGRAGAKKSLSAVHTPLRPRLQLFPREPSSQLPEPPNRKTTSIHASGVPCCTTQTHSVALRRRCPSSLPRGRRRSTVIHTLVHQHGTPSPPQNKKNSRKQK